MSSLDLSAILRLTGSKRPAEVHSLDLRNCSVNQRDLSTELFSFLINLKTLDLRGNSITSVDFESGSIRGLDLRQTGFSEFHSLQNVHGVRELFVDLPETATQEEFSLKLCFVLPLLSTLNGKDLTEQRDTVTLLGEQVSVFVAEERLRLEKRLAKGSRSGLAAAKIESNAEHLFQEVCKRLTSFFSRGGLRSTLRQVATAIARRSIFPNERTVAATLFSTVGGVIKRCVAQSVSAASLPSPSPSPSSAAGAEDWAGLKESSAVTATVVIEPVSSSNTSNESTPIHRAPADSVQSTTGTGGCCLKRRRKGTPQRRRKRLSTEQNWCPPQLERLWNSSWLDLPSGSVRLQPHVIARGPAAAAANNSDSEIPSVLSSTSASSSTSGQTSNMRSGDAVDGAVLLRYEPALLEPRWVPLQQLNRNSLAGLIRSTMRQHANDSDVGSTSILPNFAPSLETPSTDCDPTAPSSRPSSTPCDPGDAAGGPSLSFV